MNIIIRKETPEDYRQTEHMTMRAFWNIQRSNEAMKKGDSPQVGDDVLFRWKPQGESEITAICRNLL